MKTVLVFLATFVVGAAIALAVRAARHDPFVAPASGPTATVAANPHAGHASLKSDGAAVVNTVCPICGMDVDPSLKPAEYQGKLVGFGCAACPSRFAKDPARWGPHALRNEVAP